jgi:hypothetical protein
MLPPVDTFNWRLEDTFLSSYKVQVSAQVQNIGTIRRSDERYVKGDVNLLLKDIASQMSIPSLQAITILV